MMQTGGQPVDHGGPVGFDSALLSGPDLFVLASSAAHAAKTKVMFCCRSARIGLKYSNDAMHSTSPFCDDRQLHLTLLGLRNF
jgi:hypothetical protein